MENEELDLDLNLDQEAENIKRNNYQLRLKDLSEKQKAALKERDEVAQAKAEIEAREQAVIKERDFYKDFSKSSEKYPGATEYQEQILEKVKSGYTVEDATVSVLNAEGKLTARTAPRESPAGGSATNALKGDGNKELGEMNKDEKRAELMKILG